MTKNDFLNELNNRLEYLPPDEKNDIMLDYQEHFRAGEAEGLTEEDIIKRLGSPHSIAKQYTAEYHLENAKRNSTPSNVGRAIFSTIALGFFNLIFILGPFLGLVGVYIGLWGGAIGLVVGGAGLIRGGLLGSFPWFLSRSILTPFVSQSPLGAGILGIGLFALGLLSSIGLYHLGHVLIKLIVKYLNWNISLIKGR